MLEISLLLLVFRRHLSLYIFIAYITSMYICVCVCICVIVFYFGSIFDTMVFTRCMYVRVCVRACVSQAVSIDSTMYAYM